MTSRRTWSEHASASVARTRATKDLATVDTYKHKQ